MTDDSFTTADSAGDWAYALRERGWQVVPTVPWGKHGRAAAVSGPQIQMRLVDDILFNRWFGRKGKYRQARHLGIFTGAVSGGLFVFEINTLDPGAMHWWSVVAQRMGVDPGKEFTAYTGDHHLRVFLQIKGDVLPPRGMIRPGVTIFGDGDFLVIPVRTLADEKRDKGVQ